MKKPKQIWGWFWLIVLLSVVVGALLCLKLSEHFLNVPSAIWSAGRYGTGVLFVLFLGALWFKPSLHQRMVVELKHKMPTHIFRVLLGFPLVALVGAAFVSYAPVGHLLLWGYVWGDEANAIAATVIEAQPLSTSGKGCRQKITLVVGGARGEVCIQNRLIGQLPKPGQVVQVRGLVSPVGIWVKEVRTEQ